MLTGAVDCCSEYNLYSRIRGDACAACIQCDVVREGDAAGEGLEGMDSFSVVDCIY